MNEIMDTVTDRIRGFDFSLNTLLGEGNVQIITWEDMILWIVMGCIGLLCCFFGLKLVRVCGLIAGLVIGVEIGYQASLAVGLDAGYIWMASLGAGVVLGILMAVFRRAAIFVTMISAVYSVVLFLIGPDRDTLFLLIPAVIGFAFGLLSLRFREVPVLFVTGIYGAIILGNLTYNITYHILGTREDLIRFAAYVLWAAMGILVQLLFESGRRKRKNLAQAEKIRNTYSVANDVERARMFVDSEDTADGETAETPNDQNLQKDSDLEFVSLEDDEYDEDLDEEEEPEEYEESLEEFEEEEPEQYEESPEEHEEDEGDSEDYEEVPEEYEESPEDYEEAPEEHEEDSDEREGDSEEYFDEEFEDMEDLDKYLSEDPGLMNKED